MALLGVREGAGSKKKMNDKPETRVSKPMSDEHKTQKQTCVLAKAKLSKFRKNYPEVDQNHEYQNKNHEKLQNFTLNFDRHPWKPRFHP